MEFFFFTNASRSALGPTQPRIQWVTGALYAEIKRPSRESDNEPSSSPQAKNTWNYNSTPQCVFVASCLVKHRDNITLIFTLQRAGISQWSDAGLRAG
jgi:hypothetical protein